MPGDHRTEDEIHLEVTTEREQLARALADLRQSINSKRRPAAIVGGALVAWLAAKAVFKAIRRSRARRNLNQNEFWSLLKQTRWRESARNASWISARRS